ncbi:hypothetical protein G3480_10575 [Thiorhodococcus mannitoliphagus]|uniref:ApeI dehydratase-like domain-containing protein n=1 Tax=Thiorhodococcus mannitoliphagus TaxID=329406 RepID=A0A6P1DSE6_9GAMM|nr:hypothetical protein [Thiorhodococcus mannitoliphagus]NEX20749.1 hypothetical protein [Thiorhodococcus mannitoliphagus]
MWFLHLNLEKPAPDEIRAGVVVNGDSPWFDGHFPDSPILPGIAQLKMVADVVGQAQKKALWINRLHRVKFRRIVKPGELLEIHVMGTGNQYSFRITHNAEDVCSGMMSLDDKQQ